MELVEKLNDMKSALVNNGLEQYVDLINEVISTIDYIPQHSKPTEGDFFPAELEEATANLGAPVNISGGYFFFGKEAIEKYFEYLSDDEFEKADPPLKSENSQEKF